MTFIDQHGVIFYHVVADPEGFHWFPQKLLSKMVLAISALLAMHETLYVHMWCMYILHNS